MEQISKDFIDNDEAMDAYVARKTTYISVEDVDILLKKQKQQLTIPTAEVDKVNWCKACQKPIRITNNTLQLLCECDVSEEEQFCYKNNEPCKYDCSGLCKESY